MFRIAYFVREDRALHAAAFAISFLFFGCGDSGSSKPGSDVLSQGGGGSGKLVQCTVAWSGANAHAHEDCIAIIYHGNEGGQPWAAFVQDSDSLLSFTLRGIEMPFPGTYSSVTLAPTITASGNLIKSRSESDVAWTTSQNYHDLNVYPNAGDFTLTFNSVRTSGWVNYGLDTLDMVGGSLDADLSPVRGSKATGQVAIHATF